jgi:hypothetical protein
MPLACQVIVAAKHLGLDQGAVTHVILSAVWKDDLNIADAKDIASALTPHGTAPSPLIDASQGPEIAAKAASETRDAIEHGIFGSPTYVVGEDWFSDRTDWRFWRKKWASLACAKPQPNIINRFSSFFIAQNIPNSECSVPIF